MHVEWATMLVVTREGDRRCKPRPSQRAMAALVLPARTHHPGEDRCRVRISDARSPSATGPATDGPTTPTSTADTE